jgi:hypothetical protein
MERDDPMKNFDPKKHVTELCWDDEEGKRRIERYITVILENPGASVEQWATLAGDRHPLSIWLAFCSDMFRMKLKERYWQQPVRRMVLSSEMYATCEGTDIHRNIPDHFFLFLSANYGEGFSCSMSRDQLENLRRQIDRALSVEDL